MAQYAIDTHSLTRDFDGLRAVDELSLQVESNTIFGFLGPNGAGKTTTIRLLLGLLEATSGRAEVLGLDVRTEAPAIRARVGALLEDSGVYERLSAYHNLMFFADIYRLPAPRAHHRVEGLLRQIGLWDRRDEPAGRLSRGMRQKLAVARALLHEPALVFLDEPTAGLDAVAAADLRDEVVDLARHADTTVFLTTHNLDEAQRICDRVAIILKGKLIATGTPAELSARAASPALRIRGRGFSQAAVAVLEASPLVAQVTQAEDGLHVLLRDGRTSNAWLVRALVEHGADIEEVAREGASLEHAFLELVRE